MERSDIRERQYQRFVAAQCGLQVGIRDGRKTVVALIAIGWLAAVWAIVLLISIYFSKNMQ
jgi:hypothetical protein